MPGFSADSIVQGANNAYAQAQNIMNPIAQQLQNSGAASGNYGSQIVSLLQQLATALAPQKQWQQIPFSNLAPGSLLSPFPQLNNITYSGLIATLVGNLSQINVYLGPADPAMPPDFTFNSGYPSSILFFPSMQLETLTVYSAGNNPATGKISLLQY